MKHSLIFLITLLHQPSALAALDGGVHGGGGNGLHSTPEQVQTYLNDNLARLADGILSRAERGLEPSALLPIQDKQAKPVLTNILKLRNVVDCSNARGYDEPCQLIPALQSFMDIKLKGTCLENGSEHDASVSYHIDGNGNPVLDQMCFSAERLAQYPDSAFEEQLSALFLHELSHIAAYEEADAVAVQNYAVKKILTRDCSIYVYSGKPNDDFVGFGLILQEGFAPYVKVNRQFAEGRLQTFELDNYHTKLPAPVEFDWSSAGGHIQFTSLDVDGQLRLNRVEWEGDVNSVNGFTNRITKSNLTFNGKPVSATDIQVSYPDFCTR